MAKVMMNIYNDHNLFKSKDGEAFKAIDYSNFTYSPKSFIREKGSKSILKDSRSFYPVPKGNSPYSLAKKAEYIEKDLAKAESLYKKAISEGDRPESAIKDLAGVIHQQGKTLEAIEILKQHKYLFASDPGKYENLLQNLRRQVVQKGNRLNKFLKLSPLPLDSTSEQIFSLFTNSKRIIDIELYSEGSHIYAILKFSTHSAARKTLEGFLGWDQYKVEWVSITGDLAGNAGSKRGDMKKDRVLFVCKVFHRDPESRVLVLPIESNPVIANLELKSNEYKHLIGSDLLGVLDNPDN
ncbi:hypothetical protein SteCoe_14765 [Stentor coeruleus]|uniref:RRM domain-containing protein n=1 Tax=Stentor coeruleus TaxID=5963 RepID=A0A1R2C584_9CILI|nr:hypothetical protein SteCoe_14765 [Stentor coeruleus]